MKRFLSHIGKATVVDKMEDELRWKETRDGVFFVMSVSHGIWFGSLMCSRRFAFSLGKPYGERS